MSSCVVSKKPTILGKKAVYGYSDAVKDLERLYARAGSKTAEYGKLSAAIEQSLKDIKSGKTMSTDQVKQRLKIGF